MRKIKYQHKIINPRLKNIIYIEILYFFYILTFFYFFEGGGWEIFCYFDIIIFYLYIYMLYDK
jgi:hypothetical protein